jgi:hypothetical protein
MDLLQACFTLIYYSRSCKDSVESNGLADLTRHSELAVAIWQVYSGLDIFSVSSFHACKTCI